MRMRTRSAVGFAGISLANVCTAVINARMDTPLWASAIFLVCGAGFALLALREYRSDEYEFASEWVGTVRRIGSVVFAFVGLGIGFGMFALLVLWF